EESGGNGLDPTEGSYNAQEVFAEVSLPLLDELPAVYSLTVDLAARFSHYNTFGNDLTYRAGLSWAPVADVRLRGVFSTAFRAPDIADLYGGAADSYEEVDDPCNDWGASTDPNIRANCQAQGVPQDFNQSDAGGSQIRTNIGGNKDLDAETAMVANAGLVFTPTFGGSWLKNFSLTFDFYWVKVDNALTNPNPQWPLDTCYSSEGMSHPNCQKIMARNSSSVITSMEAALENIAEIETMGFDITLNYGLTGDLIGAPSWLRLDLGIHLNYLLDYTEIAMGDTIEYAGTITAGMTGGAYSHLRGAFTFAISGESWSVTNRVRYIGGADIFGTSEENGDLTRKVDAIAYWDINAQYTWEGLTFIVGLDNLIGAEPPYVLEAGQNANVQTYDFVGRFIYTKIAYKF
ncbi:MAG TPA: TonB-dependent receptor, partial [Myxococcota bacterium]|nr:TonB-dependent receptor [Myxococcota bacterium]